MRFKGLVAYGTQLIVAFTAVFAASFAGADGTGHDHGVADEVAVSPDATDSIVIERRLTELAEVISVAQGRVVQLRLTTAGPTELHLHGYDLSVAAGPDTVAVMTFHAEHAGRFAIVSHGGDDLLGRAEKPLAYIEVAPK